MTDELAIQGNYADFKLVKTRSVCQLVIEVPIERAEQAIKAFGIPQPGAEIPVAVARINPVAKQKWPHGGGMAGHDADSADEKPKERKHWGDTLRSMQAAIRVTNREWRHWAELPDNWTADDCTNWIKQNLVIESRKELDSNPEKAAAWDKLDAAFIEATRLPERH